MWRIGIDGAIQRGISRTLITKGKVMGFLVLLRSALLLVRQVGNGMHSRAVLAQAKHEGKTQGEQEAAQHGCILTQCTSCDPNAAPLFR